MTAFNSKWKEDGKPLTDIATLKYPHEIKSLDGEYLATVDDVEEAEGILDWYKKNYEHADITQRLVRSASAVQKLRQAALRSAYLERKAERHQKALEALDKAQDEKTQKKEARRADRLAARDEAARQAWAPAQQAEIRKLRDNITEAAAELSAVPTEMTRENYGKMLALAELIASHVGAFKHRHYAITASRHFTSRDV